MNGDKQETKKPVLRILDGFRVCSKIGARTLVVSWAWIREEMVRNQMKNGTMPLVLRCLTSVKVGHPVGWERGTLRSKRSGTLSIHFNGSDETAELILRTVISVNQLSVYGAEAEMCGELPWEISRNSKSTEKPAALETLETMVMPPEVSTTEQTSQTDAGVQGNLLREYEQKFADLTEHVLFAKLCSNAGLAKTALHDT